MKKVNITIDGMKMYVPESYTVLQAAKEAGINIPTLCYLKDVNEQGCCRMCLVEVKGARALQAACVYPVSEGMEVLTHTPKVKEARRVNLELILSNHDERCQTCRKGNGNCDLQTLAREMMVDDVRFEGENERQPLQYGKYIIRDPNKCILCRRCVSVCKKVQKVGVIEMVNRGINTRVASPFEMPLEDTPCINCGQCINVCPVSALKSRRELDALWEAIYDPEKIVIAQTAPAVRVALGEPFGMPIGSQVTGKMVRALKMLGFDKVFDTDYAADLTIMEEANELIDRVRGGGKLPLMTSCCPGWVKFCEYNYPDLLDNMSSCKSPHEMFGAIIKSYYAKKNNIDPSKIFVVSIMPCIAKKFESSRDELGNEGMQDVDLVITTRGLADMMVDCGIDFPALEDEDFDNPFGEGTGAGHIFGATGGVMEAALRTAADVLNEQSADNIDYQVVRGLEDIKVATVKFGDVELRAAVAHGLGNARTLMKAIRQGEHFDFVEIMACPGGCVNGGGQPLHLSKTRNWVDVRKERAAGLYSEDQKSFIRKSHKNPAIKKLYKEFLGSPNGSLSHQLLHTHYEPRQLYGRDKKIYED